MTEQQTTRTNAKVVITKQPPVVLERIPDMQLFRMGFIGTLGFGCALPIAGIFATIAGVIMWAIFGGLLLGMLG